jgi:hypothetical protein
MIDNVALSPALERTAGWATDAQSSSLYQGSFVSRRPTVTKRHPEDLVSFPERLNGQKIVGQLCRTYLGWHLFTLGVYLDEQSPAWFQTYDQSNISSLLEESVGHLTLRYKLTKKVTRRLFNIYAVQPLKPFVHDPNASTLIQEYKAAVTNGPTFVEGLVLDVYSNSSGLQYNLSENLGNRNLSKALLGYLVEDGAQIPQFREMLLQNLVAGPDVDIEMIWAGSLGDKLPATVIVIIVAGAFIVAGLLFLTCWFVWRRFRRGSSPSPPPGAIKRPAGAGQARLGARGGAAPPTSNARVAGPPPLTKPM